MSRVRPSSKSDGGRGALTLRQLRSRGEGTPPTSPASAGLKPAPVHAPRRLATTADVVKLQRLMTHALVRPLTAESGMQTTWTDGRPMAEVVGEFIKPNDRLTAFERLQLYNRMYWFRLIDAFYDDNPGLRALLGDERFMPLCEAYLVKYPSRSFTLRNLSARLAGFIAEAPQLTAPHTALALDIARFEWAQTVAFDGEAKPVLAPERIARASPQKLRLRLQPYVSLLALNYPADDYVLAVKQREAFRGAVSNTSETATRRRRIKAVVRPRRQRTFLAVHRIDFRLYYKRLKRPAYLILSALAAGKPLAEAIAAGGSRVKAAEVQAWFATWMELGWFCRK
jgi:hypothetical protein